MQPSSAYNPPSLTQPFLIEKPNLAKVDGSAQKPRGIPLSRPHRPFWGRLAAILDFWGSHRQNDQIKKLIGGSNNLRFNLFPHPVSHVGFRGWWGVTGGAALQAVSECHNIANDNLCPNTIQDLVREDFENDKVSCKNILTILKISRLILLNTFKCII